MGQGCTDERIGGEDVQLPIDVVPKTEPPRFKWTHRIGGEVLHQEGNLPLSLEGAVLDLIRTAKRLMLENAGLQGQVQSLTDRVASAELLSRRAETPDAVAGPTVEPTPKRRK
jgi:hypothetical protein